MARSRNIVGFIGKELKFFKVISESVGNPTAPAKEKNPIEDKWNAYIDKYKRESPESMGSATVTAKYFWSWTPSELAFMTSAIQGMIIAGCFAFVILIIATRNIFIAFVSLFCVASVIVSIVAIETWLGWEMGVSESLSMVTVIGFSVDYVVHLSADYMHSAEKSRNERMRASYR